MACVKVRYLRGREGRRDQVELKLENKLLYCIIFWHYVSPSIGLMYIHPRQVDSVVSLSRTSLSLPECFFLLSPLPHACQILL